MVERVKKTFSALLAIALVLGGMAGLVGSGGGKAYAATTQIWSKVGGAGFSEGGTRFASLYVYDGTPYVAYVEDADTAGKVTVMKYDGTNWVTVGSPRFSTGNVSNISNISLYMDNAGTPYVAYAEGDNLIPKVMKYDGTDWVTVGGALSSGAAYALSLYVDSRGTPYVAFGDETHVRKATVMKYDGTNWVSVGSPGFSTIGTDFTSLYVDNDGIPYVALEDHGNKAAVMKYVGADDTHPTGWAPVGSAGFSAGRMSFISLYVYNGIPYAAYAEDVGQGHKATVMKYVGEDAAHPTGWEDVGSAGFSTGDAQFNSLYVYNGTPYVAYVNAENHDLKAAVMKYVGVDGTHPTGWVPVSNTEVSSSRLVNYTSLYVYNGTPYVAYTDVLNRSKPTVMSLVTVNVPPDLTAVTTNADPAQNIELAFADDPSWRAAITAVNAGPQSLARDTDYSIGDGKITIHPGALTDGSYTITIKADGYADTEAVQTVSSFANDTGTEAEPYRIATAAQLDAVRYHLSEAGAYFQLTADIDLSGYSPDAGWLPIGNAGAPFQGNMDGTHYTITDLTIHRPGDNYIGLFGDIGNQAHVANMKLENVSIEGHGETGGLAGHSDGTITGSYATGTVTGSDGSHGIGGLVGYNGSGTITDSHASVAVSGNQTIGGLVGETHGGMVTGNYATGTVTGINLNDSVGGLAGYSEGTITDSYASVDVSGKIGVGGLVGETRGTITDSYANGTVTETDGGGWVGGLVGLSDGEVSNSYAAGSVIGGGPHVGGFIGTLGVDGKTDNSFFDLETTGQTDTGKGDGQTTDKMQTQSTYAASGWDFTGIWGIDPLHNGGYPYLRAIQKYVTYDGTGSTGGTAPMDTASYSPGSAVTVADNTESLERTGHVFAGWNTEADGSGASYAAGDTFSMGASDVTLYAQWLSANAMLGDLSVSPGALVFTPSDLNYTVDVNREVTSLDVSFTKGDPNQTIAVTGAVFQTVTDSVYDYRASDLVLGANPIQIQVTAQDGTQSSYHLSVNRPSDNADLSGMTLSDGILSPAFAAGTTNFTAGVANSVSGLTVTPTAADANATVTVNDAAVHSGTASSPIPLNAGGNTITVAVTAQDGTTIKTYTIDVTRAAPSSDDNGGGDGSSSGSDGGGSGSDGGGSGSDGGSSDGDGGSSDGDGGGTPPGEQAGQTDLSDTLNGETVTAVASATASEQDGKTVLTVTVDSDKLAKQLAGAAGQPTVVIPVTEAADQVTFVLAGDTIRTMADKEATLEVQTPIGNYKLPASEVQFDQLSQQLGAQISDIAIHVNIAKSDDAKVALLNSAADAGGFTLVVPPIEFSVTASYGDKTASLGTFSSYVEREIPIPDGVDAGKITAAVVLNEDGTTRSVPMKLVARDRKSYAAINSLTNSTYAVISSPMSFRDVTQAWAKDAVNDLASRMVIGGTGNGVFEPDRDITRAEFAAIVVRGLGLKTENGAGAFKDVNPADWYSQAIHTAHAYRLIDGFEDGDFRPNDKVTREQAMVMIARAMTITKLQSDGQSADAALQPYPDAAQASAWARSGIAACVTSGVVSGESAARLAPKDNMTRAEVAVIVERLLQKSGLI